MQSLDPFPEEIKKFIDANIESIEQLEILRVLGECPQREWSFAELAKDASHHATATSQIRPSPS